jgi:hypothetical protein
MKSIAILFFITFSSIGILFSQEYQHAVGIKSGYPGYIGINVKSFKGRFFAWDNTLGTSFHFDNHYISLYSLYEYNKGFGQNEGYNWYLGAGPEVHYYTKGGYVDEKGIVSHDGLFARLDGVFGLEFLSRKADLNVAIDIGPSFTFFPIIKIGPIFNVSIRYGIRSNKYREFRQIEPIEKKKAED